MQYVTLNNGVKMPQLGLGVLYIDDLTECERVVSEALEVGYRLIDTAAGYQTSRQSEQLSRQVVLIVRISS